MPDPIRALAAPSLPAVAAFDADGVLWHGDVSEDFALWMIGEGRFDGRLWPAYEHVNARDPAAGCMQILQLYAGRRLDDVRLQVERFWQVSPERRWLPRVQATVRWAKQQGLEVHVVSATPAVVLQPLRRHLPVDRVLGLELELDAQGRCTGRSTGIATIGPGKAERLRAATRAPVVLAAGNSRLDLALLRLSTGVAWAINPDDELRATAEQAGWLVTREPVE